MKDIEQNLLEQGWKKETLSIHLSQYDENAPFKHRRLSYDLDDSFSSNQISLLRQWVGEVNKRFPDIKIFLDGTGYVQASKD